MSAQQWIAACAVAVVILAMSASILNGSGDHQTYARLNPETGKMEMVDPVFLASSTGSSIRATPGKARWKKRAPTASAESSDKAQLMVPTAVNKAQFVE